MGVVIVIAAIALAAVACVVVRPRGRAELLRAVADDAGLAYRREDPFGLAELPLPLLAVGAVPTVEHVLWKVDPEVTTARAFDLVLHLSSGEDRWRGRLSAAVVELPSSHRLTHVGPPLLLSLLEHTFTGRLALVHDEGEGWEARTEDPVFLAAFLTPEVRRLLGRVADDVAVTIVDRYLAVWSEELAPHHVPTLLAVCERLAGVVPGSVTARSGDGGGSPAD